MTKQQLKSSIAKLQARIKASQPGIQRDLDENLVEQLKEQLQKVDMETKTQLKTFIADLEVQLGNDPDNEAYQADLARAQARLASGDYQADAPTAADTTPSKCPQGEVWNGSECVPDVG